MVCTHSHLYSYDPVVTGWVTRQRLKRVRFRRTWYNCAEAETKTSREEKGGSSGLALPPMIPEQLPGGLLQGRGGSPGLAVQGCGRDATLLLFSAAAAVRAQALLLQARSAAAAAVRHHCCWLTTAGASAAHVTTLLPPSVCFLF